jgi:hypothetical protein
MNPAGCYHRGQEARALFILSPSPLSSQRPGRAPRRERPLVWGSSTPQRGEELSAVAGYSSACFLGVSPCPVTQEAEMDKNQASRVLKLRAQRDIMPGLGGHPVEVGCPADVVS